MKITMLFTFLRALYYFLKRGCETLPKAKRDERLAMCKRCIHLKDHRCQLCGCWVALKTYCVDEHCPEIQW